jgi:hypothetical protein
MTTWSNFTSTGIAPGGVEISSTYSDNAATATPPTWSTRVIIANTALDGQASIPRFAGHGSNNVYVAWRQFRKTSPQPVLRLTCIRLKIDRIYWNLRDGRRDEGFRIGDGARLRRRGVQRPKQIRVRIDASELGRLAERIKERGHLRAA